MPQKIRLLMPGHSTGYAEPANTWVGEPIHKLLEEFGVSFSSVTVKIDNKRISDSGTIVPEGCTITVSKAVSNG